MLRAELARYCHAQHSLTRYITVQRGTHTCSVPNGLSSGSGCRTALKWRKADCEFSSRLKIRSIITLFVLSPCRTSLCADNRQR